MDREQQVEHARRYLVDAWQSFKKNPGDSWGTEKYYEKHDEFKEKFGLWQSLPYRILAASPHLQGISGHEEILDKLLESMPLLEALEILERELG